MRQKKSPLKAQATSVQSVKTDSEMTLCVWLNFVKRSSGS